MSKKCRKYKKWLRNFIAENKWLLVILFVAIILRIIGLRHGFPFVLHPDEPSTIRSAMGLRFNLNPGHFDWPHLMFYVNFIVYAVFIKFRALVNAIGLEPTSTPPPLFWRDPLIFYYISRFVSALIGAFTVIPVYLTGKTLLNKKAGLYSAALFAVIPFHVWTSHFALIDVPSLFWISWSMFFSSRIIFDKKATNYVWAGLFIGLAASTKYNGGLLALMVPLAHFLRTGFSRNEKLISLEGIRNLVFSGFTAVFGFLVGTPFALFDYKTFTITENPNGALWQFTNVGKTSFLAQIKQTLVYFSPEYSKDFGYVISSLFIVYALFGVFKWKKFDIRNKQVYLFLVTMTMFVVFYISGFEKSRSHYYIVSYGFFALSSGIVILQILDDFKFKSKKYKNMILAIIFAIPLFFSLQNVFTILQKDTRVQLYDWLLINTKENTRIGYNTSTLDSVMEKFKQTKPQKIKGLNEFDEKGMFWVKAIDNDLDTEIQAELSQRPELIFKAYFSSHLRRGPDILIFKLGAE